MITEYYTLLGLLPGASAYEVKAAYERLVLKLRPSFNSVVAIEAANKRFNQIKQAFDAILSFLQNQVCPPYDYNQNPNSQDSRHLNHLQFDENQLKAQVRHVSHGQGMLTRTQNNRPRWISTPRLASNALINPHSNQHQCNSQYQYTRQYEGRKSGEVTLNLTQAYQQIVGDFSFDENIKAGIELALAASWPGVLAPSTLPQNTLNKIRAHCKQHNMTFSTYRPEPELQPLPQSTQMPTPSAPYLP